MDPIHPPDPSRRVAHVHSLLSRAQTNWLSKQDVLDILTNWEAYNFRLSMTAPDRPGPGSLFLFDRTQLRSFRRDNIDWRKKADGKTVQETHEKLKINGGIQALNCYYTHSADGKLQRRCYWKLTGNTSIVLMHYQSAPKPKVSVFGDTESPKPSATVSKPQPRASDSNCDQDAHVNSPQAVEPASEVRGTSGKQPDARPESRGGASGDIHVEQRRDLGSMRSSASFFPEMGRDFAMTACGLPRGHSAPGTSYMYPAQNMACGMLPGQGMLGAGMHSPMQSTFPHLFRQPGFQQLCALGRMPSAMAASCQWSAGLSQSSSIAADIFAAGMRAHLQPSQGHDPALAAAGLLGQGCGPGGVLGASGTSRFDRLAFPNHADITQIWDPPAAAPMRFLHGMLESLHGGSAGGGGDGSSQSTAAVAEYPSAPSVLSWGECETRAGAMASQAPVDAELAAQPGDADAATERAEADANSAAKEDPPSGKRRKLSSELSGGSSPPCVA